MRNKFTAVEIGIFAIVSLIFVNSVYHLFVGDRDSGQQTRQVAQAATGPTPPYADGKKITDLAVYETHCTVTGESYSTSASKVRVLGPVCGALKTGDRGPASASNTAAAAADANDVVPPPVSTRPLLSAKVENVTTKFQATVFNDHGTADFSTDFIPLIVGENRIRMEFRYKDGKTVPVELKITRN